MSVYYEAAVAFVAFAGLILTIMKFVTGRFDRISDKLNKKIDDYVTESREAYAGIGKRIDRLVTDVSSVNVTVAHISGQMDREASHRQEQALANLAGVTSLYGKGTQQ